LDGVHPQVAYLFAMVGSDPRPGVSVRARRPCPGMGMGMGIPMIVIGMVDYC
jgi:hypothetical protein